jgi:NADPH-dependent 2,4-dienoyl-CoA reductase/sulfur reductase-like enzyme
MSAVLSALSASLQSCEVLVVGAGPAGLSAAQAAASGGALVVVLDDNPRTGGQIWRGGPYADLPMQATRLQTAVQARANIRILTSANVIGRVDAHTLLIETEDGALHLRWQKLIVCTGARERLLPFPGWTLPGVTGAGGLQALIKGGLPVRGDRVVIGGNGPLLFAVAATARKAGAKVLLVAEQVSLARVTGFARKLPLWPSKLVQAVQLRDASYRTSSTVLSAQGRGQVEAATVQQGSRTVTLECTRVAVGYGLVPNIGLAQALGCRTHTADGVQVIAVDAYQATSLPDIFAAGECTGIGGCERAMAQGSIAGYASIGEPHKARAFEKDRAYWSAFAAHANACFELGESLKKLPAPDTLVCRCEDVRHQTLQGFANWTEAKIHSRCGMGACQGKVCGTAAEFLYGWQPPETRMPFTTARIGTLAASSDTAAQGE